MMAVSAGVNNLDDLNNDGPMSIMQKMMKFKSGEAGSFDDYVEDQQKKDSGMGGFMTAYRLTGESKVKGVCEFMETLAENGAKFLVFAHHQAVMDELQNCLQSKKVGHVRIDGKVQAEIRHDRVTAFQTDPKIRAAILSITAASQGLTLTAASTIVFAELTWTPSMMNQAEDRAHRIGQKNSVNIYYMHGRGTIDD